jgi:hypothetical protein
VRVPKVAVPVLVVAFAGAGLFSSRFLAVPTLTRTFVQSAPALSSARTSVFLVDGLKCRDTAEKALSHLEGVAGVLGAAAYASRNEARVTFDPSVTDPRAIREAFEGPEYDPATGEIWFGRFTVVEIDGVPMTAESEPPSRP